MNLYLTGSTGFLGKLLVKEFQNNNNIKNVYLPIRNKKDLSGKERFSKIFNVNNK